MPQDPTNDPSPKGSPRTEPSDGINVIEIASTTEASGDQGESEESEYQHPFDKFLAVLDSDDEYMEGYDKEGNPYINKKMKKVMAMKERLRQPSPPAKEWKPRPKPPKQPRYKLLRKVMPKEDIPAFVDRVSTELSTCREVNVLNLDTEHHSGLQLLHPQTGTL